MLDSNSVSYALGGNPPSVREHLRRVPMAQVCFSSITEAELLFGLAVKTQATKFAELVNQFLLGVSVLPWDSAAAKAYADLYAASWKRGRPPRRHGHARGGSCLAANSFRCNTYKKQGAWGGVLLVRSAECPFLTYLLSYLLTSSFLLSRRRSS